MERRKFIRTCGYTVLGLPLLAGVLQSCSAIYYTSVMRNDNMLTLPRSEFWKENNGKRTERPFVLFKEEETSIPICIYKTDQDQYVASLMECTHRGCELEVAAGIYSCPCHGSEFSMKGEVLEGPANRNLKTFKVETDNDFIYISLA